MAGENCHRASRSLLKLVTVPPLRLPALRLSLPYSDTKSIIEKLEAGFPWHGHQPIKPLEKLRSVALITTDYWRLLFVQAMKKEDKRVSVYGMRNPM